jgi:hypothetical protein
MKKLKLFFLILIFLNQTNMQEINYEIEQQEQQQEEVIVSVQKKTKKITTKPKPVLSTREVKLTKLKSKLNGFDCPITTNLIEIINNNLKKLKETSVPPEKLTKKRLNAMKKYIEKEFIDDEELCNILLNIINHGLALETIKEKDNKNSYQNQIINCDICGVDVKRKSLYAHKNMHKKLIECEEIKDFPVDISKPTMQIEEPINNNCNEEDSETSNSDSEEEKEER